MRGFLAVLAILVISGALVAGCGDDSSDSGGGSSGSKSSTPSGNTLAANAADGAKGNVTLCLPKDVSGAFHKTIDAFNAEGNGVTAKLLELPESADEQRNQLVQRSEAHSGECDVMG